jgi:hypothetical protein
MGDEMPRDPFREGQVDFGPIAANDTAFLSAHLAAGMTEVCALELTKVYLQFMLGVLLAGSGQSPEQDGTGESD